MGKRSDFERRERDFYPTPESAVVPLLPHLSKDVPICEPCAGDGALVDHLKSAGFSVVDTYDVEPRRPDIFKLDATEMWSDDLEESRIIITNPPWKWELLTALLDRFSFLNMPAWLLLSADIAHNKRAAEYMKRCERIVSVGRVKWIPDSPYAGKDNAAWYLFNPLPVASTTFYARAA